MAGLCACTVGLWSVATEAEAADREGGFGYLDRETNRTLVPIRFVSESLGATVNWDQATRQVTVTHEGNEVNLVLGEREARVNGSQMTLESPPALSGGRTYVPLRFVNDALGFQTDWDQSRYMATVMHDSGQVDVTVDQGRATQRRSGSVSTGSGSIQASYRIIDLTDRHLIPEMALAGGEVGEVSSLSAMARGHSARFAVNGTFFDAYSSGNRDPYGVIVKDRDLVHIGRGRTVIGFDAQNEVVMDVVNPRVSGTTGGSDSWENNWYVTWINRHGGDSGNQAIMYTPQYGSSVSHGSGVHVVVRDGVVTSMTSGSTAIPNDGYVLYFNGSLEDQFRGRFSVGTEVDYDIAFQPEYTAEADWQDVVTAVGAGPRLVRNGNLAVGTTAEGFNDPSITTRSGARTAIGVTADRRLILLTTRSATIPQLAGAMRQLGAVDAMNLDGGASSGMYDNGSYVTRTGRQISNALIFR